MYLVFITIGSLSPIYDVDTYRYFHNEDKIFHLIMYAILSFLIGLVFRDKQRISPLRIMIITIISSLYGILMEILQDVLDTGRMFDLYDIVANIFGAFAGTMLFYMLNRS